MYIKLKQLKWVNSAVLKIKSKISPDTLGCMEMKYNTVVETMLLLQASFSDGLLLLSTWMQNQVITQEFSSKTETPKKDASKYLKRILPEEKLIPLCITLTKLINSIVFIVVTNSTKNLRTHGVLIIFLFQITSRRFNPDLQVVEESWHEKV